MNSRNIVTLVIASIIFGLGVGVGVRFFIGESLPSLEPVVSVGQMPGIIPSALQPPPTPSGAQTITPPPSGGAQSVAAGKTYTNPTYGFSFKYPADWGTYKQFPSKQESPTKLIDPITAALVAVDPKHINCGPQQKYTGGAECLSITLDPKLGPLSGEVVHEQSLQKEGAQYPKDVQYTKDTIVLGGISSIRFTQHASGFNVDNQQMTIYIPGKGHDSGTLTIQANCFVVKPKKCSTKIFDIMDVIVIPSFLFF